MRKRINIAPEVIWLSHLIGSSQPPVLLNMKRPAPALKESNRHVPLRSLQFEVNGELFWNVDLRDEDEGDAHKRALDEMRMQARAFRVTDFDGLVRALRMALMWTDDQARALALAFVFPGPYALDRITAHWEEPKRRGRPTSVERAVQVSKLALGWFKITKTCAGIGHSRFQTAFAAAAPFLGLRSMRGHDLQNIDRFLRQERRKLNSKQLEWDKPLHHGEPGILQFTTP